MPATSPLRTRLDLGAVDAETVATTSECVLISGLVGVTAVRTTLAVQRRRGRRGVGALDAALDRLPLGPKVPDSVLEPRTAELFRRYEIAG